MSLKNIIQDWVNAFNLKDYEKLAEFYHEDAINHQIANEPIFGKAAIGEMFKNEFQYEMTCIVENIFEDNDWAILEWRDPNGLRGCGFFHFIDGKIKMQRGYWDKMTMLKANGFEISITKPSNS